jgi:hypothetical protein
MIAVNCRFCFITIDIDFNIKDFNLTDDLLVTAPTDNSSNITFPFSGG